MGALDGRVAVVSGAGTGLGRAAAIAFAQAGAKVVLLGRRKSKLEQTAELIRHAGNGADAALVIPTDIADERQANRAIETALSVYGRLDILINNAAILEPGRVFEMPENDWSKQIAVNLTGPFLLTKAALPPMRKAHYGRIVNITSSLAANGAGGYAAYAAAKAGLESLTRTVADEESEHGIIVNLYDPGTLKTEMHATGKDPQIVTPDLIRLASLPPGGPSGTLVSF
jgi:3-oxoacyl-[acyl-carrier protein] reductase